MFNFQKTSIIVASAMSIFFFSAMPSYAVSIRNGNTVSIPQNETIKESVFIGGNSITINGTVDGDIFCGGQDIEINGVVNGDVICAGQSIIISGQIKGNVRAAGQKILINGRVDRNVNLFGQSVRTGSGSAILGEAFIGSQSVDIEGSIDKKFSGGAESVHINGTVGDVDIETENLSLGATALVRQNLTYVSHNTATIASSEAVMGTVLKKTPAKAPNKPSERKERVVASLVTQIILAFVIIYFVSKPVKNASRTMQERMWPSFGYGALILFLVPIIMIVFVITLIGIPFAMVLLFLYIFSFLVSRVLVATVIGRMLLQQFWSVKKENDYWAVAVGLLAIWLISFIPIIGGIFSFVCLIWGLGGVYFLLRRSHSTQ